MERGDGGGAAIRANGSLSSLQARLDVCNKTLSVMGRKNTETYLNPLLNAGGVELIGVGESANKTTGTGRKEPVKRGEYVRLTGGGGKSSSVESQTAKVSGREERGGDGRGKRLRAPVISRLITSG